MGKILKNLLIVLVSFLIISELINFFYSAPKINQVQISEISSLLNQGKVETLTLSDNVVTAKIKDSDVQQQAKITAGTDAVSFFKDTGVDPKQLTPDKVKISYDLGSTAGNLAGTFLPFLLPFY